jgi:hypothetical protein
MKRRNLPALRDRPYGEVVETIPQKSVLQCVFRMRGGRNLAEKPPVICSMLPAVDLIGFDFCRSVGNIGEGWIPGQGQIGGFIENLHRLAEGDTFQPVASRQAEHHKEGNGEENELVPIRQLLPFRLLKGRVQYTKHLLKTY